MSILKQTSTVYNFNTNQLKELIANDLGLDSNNVQIDFIIVENRDFADRPTGGSSVTGIKVTVK